MCYRNFEFHNFSELVSYISIYLVSLHKLILTA